jgi:tetratricopeptide (TPR) repeat protein
MTQNVSHGKGQARQRRAAPDPKIRQLISGKPTEDYFTFDWMLLFATYVVMALIFFLFTPYTHQLDEIKNMFLMSLPPFLFLAAVYGKDFSTFSWKTHGSTILLGALVAEMLISWLLNPYKLIGERVVWFQLSCMTFTVVFAWYMDTEAKLRKTMLFYVLTSFAATAIGLFLYAGRGFTDQIYAAMKQSRFWSPQAKNLMLTLATSKEMYSTILNSDFFAAYLVMTIPIPLSMFFVEKRLFLRALAATTFLLMNVCLVFTNSNDSFMSMVFLTYPIYFLLAFRHFRKINIPGRLLATFLAGSAVLFVTVFVLMIPKLSQTWDFKTSALEGRKVLWSGGFWPWLYRNDVTKTHLDWIAIIFGTGPGGYRFYFPVFRRPDFFDNQINNVTTFGHNFYLDYLLEFGLVGLLLFLAFYGRVLYDGARQVLRRDPSDSGDLHTSPTQAASARLAPEIREVLCYYQIAILAGLSGIALQNFFSPNNRWAVCGMIYWSLFGLSMGIHHIENPGRPSALSTRLGHNIRYAALALGVLFLVRSTPQGIDHFRGAIEHGLGLTYMEIADYREEDKTRYLEKAKEHFLQAIAINPTFASSYYKLAHVYNQLGEVDNAIRVYEALDRVFPHYSEIHLNMGIMYSVKAADLPNEKEKLEMLEKAYSQIKEAARQELKPNVQWIAGMIGKQLVSLYEDLAEPNAPADAKALAEKLNPNNKRVQEIREELKQYYRNIIEYVPKLEEYQVERKKYYEKAENELVALAFLTRKLDEAEELLAKLYREDPSRTKHLAQLLALYDKRGKTKEKLAFLEDVTHGAPTDVGLRRILAEAYRDAGENKKYLAELRKIEVIDPNNEYALTELLKLYHDLKDTTKTLEYREKVRKIGKDPEAVLKGKRTSGTLEMLGDAEEALLKIEEKNSQPQNVASTASREGATTDSAQSTITLPTSRAHRTTDSDRGQILNEVLELSQAAGQNTTDTETSKR